ncbi:MAG TPA: hypothetical protein VF584_23095 [Longimicrobium sp.]
MHTFDPVPDEEVPVARRGGTFCGVRLPRSVPFFDCRWDSARPEPRNPDTGVIMWGTERAEFALGERTAGSSTRFAHPAGTLTHHDATEPRHAHQTAEDVRRLRGMLARELWEYRKARLNPPGPGEGGGVVFRPVAVALTNFGSTILADPRGSLTYRLDGARPARAARAKRRNRRAPARRAHAMEGEPTVQLGTT